MNNDQPILDNPLADIITELRGAIKDVSLTQETFSLKSAEYSAAVNNGLQKMQASIVEINDLIDQIMGLITILQKKISALEDNQAANPVEIAKLQNQLSAAQATQAEAATAMRESIDALKANNDAMSNSANAQDVKALNSTITETTTSLAAIKTKLENLLQNTPSSTLNPNAAPFFPAANSGGKRRRRKSKTAKKQRKTRRRKTKRNQKGGYVYNTKRNSDSDSGRGRGINTKRKKRRITR
jgi:hypothetical protein